MGYKVGIAGATGLVGRTMIEVLEKYNVPVDEIHLFASSNAEKREILFCGDTVEVKSLTEDNIPNLDIVLFALSSELSLKSASKFTDKGAFVIDNSSAFRMDNSIPLIVPEVNLSSLDGKSKIIANPNCSTIQLVVALKEIHKNFGINKLIVSTYQSVAGAGRKGLDEYKAQVHGSKEVHNFPFIIFNNTIPQIGKFLDNGYCTEEMKMIQETRKIYNDYSIEIFPTVVRVPVEYSHAESVTVFTKKDFEPSHFTKMLQNTDSVIFSNNVITQADVSGKDEVFVSRLRFPENHNNTAQMWVVADNVRKGAATNAVQIAKALIEKGLL